MTHRNQYPGLCLDPSRAVDPRSQFRMRPEAALPTTSALASTATRIRHLKEALGVVTKECARASENPRAGTLYRLLRKKWKLMQELFEAENQLRLSS